MDPQPSAPPVVAVVVTCDPGDWLEACLGALAAQDYPNLSVLVVDAASANDPTPRVAAVMPSAYVRRIGERGGFAAAANEAIGAVEGASHLLFCHDDVAPATDAVRLLVEEAFRSNAGVVTPKLVQWDEPDRLLAVGTTSDKGGVLVPLVERGELDQEQHDAVRDVFAAPAGCLLVRADLFGTLGGFDPTMAVAGAELDLSWRSHVVGARLVVAPQAVVRHREVTLAGLRAPDGTLARPLVAAGAGGETAEPAEPIAAGGAATAPIVDREVSAETARLRAVLKNYSLLHVLRVVPQLLAVTVAEVVVALVSGRLRRVGPLLRPWRANLTSLGSVGRARRALRPVRAVPDSEVRALQLGGNARLRALLLGAGGAAVPVRASGVDLAKAWREGLRLTVWVWAAVIAVLLFGTRHLLGRHVPLVGQFVPFASPGTLWQHALSGWRTTGMGSSSPAPTAFALLAAAGAVLWGHVVFLQRLLVLGAIPLGAAGAFRLGRSFGSRRARLATTVLYLANPLPYDALAAGHWSGLIAYAVVPWILVVLLGATGLAPFTVAPPPDEGAETGPRARPVPMAARIGGLGVILAAAGALVPALLGVAAGIGLVLVIGSLVGGGLRPSLRALWVAAGAVVVAGMLLFPWVLGSLRPGAGLSTYLRPAPPLGHEPGLAQLLRFQTGPLGAGPFGWALLATAALPLLIGGEWRHAWATRLWVLALAAWALVWVGGRGWLPFPLPDTEVILAPGAAALATCAGLGLAAFEIDLRGYHFGWRQLVSTLAAAAAVLAVLPVLGASFDGRWHAPARGFDEVLSWLPDRRVDGDFRVLWLGDPAVLPIASWKLGARLGYASSRNGLPDVSTSWPGPSGGATSVLASAVTLAEHDQTSELGHLLAPMAVRYLVVVQRSSPSTQPGVARPAPAILLSGLRSQIDLRRVDIDSSLVLYENAAWAPARSIVPAAAVAPSQSANPAAARTAQLAGAIPVLRAERSPTSFAGDIAGSDQILLSEAPSKRWQLRVGGVAAQRRTAFGVVNAFLPSRAGPASLTYRTSPVVVAAVAGQAVLWLATLVWLWRGRRRRRRPLEAEIAAADDRPLLVPQPVEVGT